MQIFDERQYFSFVRYAVVDVAVEQKKPCFAG